MEQTKEVEQTTPVDYKTESSWPPKFLAKVAAQVKNEFEVGEKHFPARLEAWRVYLKLYINQRLMR